MTYGLRVCKRERVSTIVVRYSNNITRRNEQYT